MLPEVNNDPLTSLPADSDTTQDVSLSTHRPLKVEGESSDPLPDIELPIRSSIPEFMVPRSVATNSLGKCSMEGNYNSSSKEITISSPIVLAVPWPTNFDVSLSTYQSSTSPCIRAHTAVSRRSCPRVEDSKIIITTSRYPVGISTEFCFRWQKKSSRWEGDKGGKGKKN